MANQPVREFNVRAAGSDRSFQKFILGKFPLGPPELKTPGTAWRKSERECYIAKPDRNSTKEPEMHKSGKQWVLNDSNNTAVQPLLIGQPEAGMGDGSSGAGYFLLIRHRGSEDFLALPVREWQNFKPVVQRQTNSLEDAEAEMKRKRLAAEKVNPRLAQAVKALGGEEGPTVPGDEDDNDSDAEWKDIRARAASRQAIRTAPQQRRTTAGGDEEEEVEREEGDREEISDKGEDWEHEDEAADDDLDMGEGEDDAAAEVSPVRRPRAGSASSDEEDNVAPAKVSRTLKRMMRQTGLEDSDEEDESEGEEESESIEDDEDLDKMATGLLGRDRSPSPAAQGAEEAASKKRKASTPGPAAAAGSVTASAAARPTAAAASEQQAKRPRNGSGAAAVAPALRSDAVAAAPASPAAAAGASASGGDVVLPVSEEEVRVLLEAHGRLPLSKIAQHFKARLRVNEEKNAFTQLVRRIAKLDTTPSPDGQKYLVLR